ncbi:MAG TPA: adenylate/guanylate cyclase domain-containing protein [Marinospirillum sp.]|uniref:adenylate/guanylate cyclase domain-containing protein n=1 Tax=Marinospirillum sp. TaxID=2183934 RepID=UPI002B46B1C8|nr:adenylate/guanylate cyclase domain-containing protein [Marinospirillum sp.]HKM15108.1 adenylate/guanylate cyclase domain-containing protein [Marinospirillum sp.]
MVAINWTSLLKKQGIYLLALCLLGLVFLLTLKPPVMVQSLASALSDSYFDWNKRKPSNKLVFLEIENTSIQAFGRWPWSRDLIAQGLKGLEAADVIGLDMLFSEPTDLEQDQELAKVLESLSVIGGVFLNGPQAKELDEVAYSQILHSSLMQIDNPQLIDTERAELPIPILREALPFLAALNIAPDADQKFRHYPLAFWLQDAVLPNLGVQMWRLGRYEDLQLVEQLAVLGKQKLPIDKKSQARLNFYPEDAWQRVTFAELMQPTWDPQLLADRWVLVGVSEAGVTDLRATPIGQLAGPLVHLTFLANLLDNSFLTDITGWALLASLLVILLFLSLIWQLSLPWLRLLLSLILGLAVYGVGVSGYLFFNLWLEVFYPLLFLLAAVLVGELWLFIVNRIETAYLRTAFSSYIAPALVDTLVAQGAELQLGGKRQQLSVLFSDLRGFTPTTELLTTEDLVSHLNRYFGLMIDQVHCYNGTLDKLIGDAVMALFNAPLKDEDHAYHACLAAAGMMQALDAFNLPYSVDDPHYLRMGIGINTGEAVVGNIGAANRFNYTAIGDAVNTAARLESVTKEVNLEWQVAKQAGEVKPCETVDILIGEKTFAAVKDRLPCYPVTGLELKGKSQAQNAWILDWRKMIELGLLL